MTQQNYFQISSDYGYNKRDFTLLENFETNYSKINEIEVKKNKYDCLKCPQNISNKKKTNIITNDNVSNNFPLAWTCYKSNNKWICPMRGDT